MKFWSLLVALLALMLVTGLQADEKKADKADKEVTLKGTLVCGKCTLKETDECSNVLQVKEGDKTVNYYIDDDGKKEKYHKGICPPDSKKDATVTGVVSEKDGKKHIKASKVDVK
jgi:hypothetical protein